MDSILSRDKTDSPINADLCNESLDWIRSMNLQMKSPGNYISSRLESVSLEQLHREFSSLLLSSQSHGSSLLRTAFTNATSYNDNLKKIIMSLWPIKDKVSESYNFWKNVRDNSLHINDSVNTLLNRLCIISYTKLAISTILQAQDNFNNLCDEIIDTFSALHAEDISTKHYTKISHVIALVELISKKVYKMNTLIQNLSLDYNLESNWVLLEFAPKEIKKIANLISKFKYYDNKIGEMLNTKTNSKYELYKSNNEYMSNSCTNNISEIILMECKLDPITLDKLNEFSISKFEKDIESLIKSLSTLIEVCANISFTRLYRLYTDLTNFSIDEIVTNDDNIQKYKIKDEINKYLSSLVSIINGNNQLNMRTIMGVINVGGNMSTSGTINTNNNSSDANTTTNNNSVLVDIFNETFLIPYLESNNLLLNMSSRNFLSFQEESNNFPKFVDTVENGILNGNKSIVMRFLNDVAELMGDESFKSTCILGPLAKAILNYIEESYSSIFAPIYPEYYSQNYRAFERLLTVLEINSDSTLRNLLKWRGTTMPYNYSTRFCTGVICDNYIEKVYKEVQNEFEKHHELDGNYHRSGDKKFYLASSMVVYNKVNEMFGENNFFYHLFPQYLKGVWEVFKSYINHVDCFITHMESTNNSSDLNENVKWPSGLSFAYSTYVLHDILQIVDSLKVLSIKSSQFSNCTIKIDSNFGKISQKILKIVQKPLNTYLYHYYNYYQYNSSHGNTTANMANINTGNDNNNTNTSKQLNSNINSGHNMETDVNDKLKSIWNNCLNVYYNNDGVLELNNESLRNIQTLFIFTIKSMQLICDFIINLQDHINFVKDKLEQYVVNSLYNSSKCSLQFIQSLSSKYRTSNKNDSYQVSDYVKFLVAPMLSFNEFTQDIIPQELLRSLMMKSIELVSADYISHISNLLKSVEALNVSLMNPKNVSLGEYSESFLIVDMEMLRKRISKDVEEFYEVCVNKFGVDKNHCSSLRLLMEYSE